VARRAAATAAGLAAAAAAVVALRATVLAPGEPPPAPVAATPAQPAVAAADPACPATGHENLGVTGREPAEIPRLPPDYSFLRLAADGCTPVRWDSCQPVHYVVNPTGATPTGVADVREAFARMGRATGISFVDDGETGEEGSRRRAAYQPERYGERWAPILVYWRAGSPPEGVTQVVGGGFPTRAGDSYVSGVLFLNADAVTDFAVRQPVAGGFGPDRGAGPVGPAGVTWGRIILHEVAHLLGLGHVRDPGQLMYPETADQTTRPTKLSAGDLAGLAHLGAAAGCHPAPPPG